MPFLGIFPTWHNVAYCLANSQGNRKMESISWRQQRHPNNRTALDHVSRINPLLFWFSITSYASFLCRLISPLPSCSNSTFPYGLVQGHATLLDFFQLGGWTHFSLQIWWHSVLYNRELAKYGNKDWFWSHVQPDISLASLIYQLCKLGPVMYHGASSHSPMQNFIKRKTHSWSGISGYWLK